VCSSDLDAVALLPPSVDWRCWIVGGADTPLQQRYLAELEQAAAAGGVLDRIRFTGPRYDIGSVLAAADIFCHPNVSPEAFGIVFIEALRAGLPVVGSASGGVLDIVTPECGRLVPAGDVAALAAVLTELVLSPSIRQALGEQGPARASALSDANARANDFAAALTEFIRPCSIS
jgi:glycosyltransferase involved in cell wall biosynthesis